MKKNNLLKVLICLVLVCALVAGGIFVVKHFTGLHVSLNINGINDDIKIEN